MRLAINIHSLLHHPAGYICLMGQSDNTTVVLMAEFSLLEEDADVANILFPFKENPCKHAVSGYHEDIFARRHVLGDRLWLSVYTQVLPNGVA